ncbi:MAG: copper oxidase, partial [Burkholderiaceae bacterium]
VKVRRDQKPGDYSNPGWYTHPEGTVAYEWAGPPLAVPVRSSSPGSSAMPRQSSTEIEVQVQKPGKKMGGHQHHH